MRALGIDTSNYTTSAAMYDSRTAEATQRRMLLPIPDGGKGLRQSDAVFHHIKRLPGLLEELMQGMQPPDAVGVSVRPRDAKGSYMPCFLAGEMAARAIASAMKIKIFSFSHQAGHIAAALYGAGAMELAREPFLAFHASGGATECLLVGPGREIPFEVEILGETRDLSAGQVIDRVGVMLGLRFPAGPQLEKLAVQSEKTIPVKPVLKDSDCCLSGLENQCAALIESGEHPADVAGFCQNTVGGAILGMAKDAAKKHPGLPFVFAGGVMSNARIRELAASQIEGAIFAPAHLSADNAVGVAVLCHMRSQR